MTGEQQAIPVPVAPESGACGWCGKQTRTKLILDHGKTRAANGVMVPKFTRWAWVCPAHERSLQRRGEA